MIYGEVRQVKRAHINIHGIVQGVGFRPFVHRLVRDHGLCGYIKNTSSGVELELEGCKEALESFAADISAKAPRLSLIERLEIEYFDELYGYSDFQIRPSKIERYRNTLISPDICVCDDCLRELITPGDRRYRYPFINCTNCGPRFTIIKDLPYDRASTSMEGFPMCPDCEREYHDIENRRYHAQPDCCPDCGPHTFFVDAEGRPVSGDAIERAREYLIAGKIIAVKGLGGIHLACRCDNESIVNGLRTRKHRDEKPFALMCRDVDCVREICFVSEAEEKLLTGPRRPIVLLRKKERNILPYISENAFIGVMLPYTPIHYLLFGDSIDMLVMTSANLSDSPIIYGNDEAIDKLHGIADGFLLHNRDIQTRCDDSLCWVLDGKEYFVRRSRGYTPSPLKLPGSWGMFLACGAEQKASFCLSRGDGVFQSQHIGDLKNIETYENYEQQIRHFERLFDIKPRAIACDLHPDYMSSDYALLRSDKDGIPLIRVQHHHAHMASCMADNCLSGPVIGLIWDGTGYGEGGTIWGGECLVGDYSSFTRAGSIREISLPGGDLAAKEISRAAFSLLRDSGCDTSYIHGAENYEHMISSGLNCPLSSGMGRLFDGVAGILGIKHNCSYEGQGAVLLEAAAVDDGEHYSVCWERAPVTGEESAVFSSADVPLRFDWRCMVREIVLDRAQGVETGRIAARFMNTLVYMAVELCSMVSQSTGINDIVLSGGTFQNMYLMRMLPPALVERGLRVWHHSRVSTNDEGISLGQLMILRERLEI